MKLIEAKTNRVICEQAELATTFWRRFVGLQLRRELTPRGGMLLAPCSSLHTCFVRFAIDVALLDRTGVVVAVRKNVRPWRFVLPVRGAFAALEMTASCDLLVGEEVLLDGFERLPTVLQCWQSTVR